MPCDMRAYPKTWQETRDRILKRAGNRCEECRVPNYAVGYRDAGGKFVPLCGNAPCDAAGRGRNDKTGEPLTYAEAKEFVDLYNDHGDGKRKTDGWGNHWIVIVLTIAHLDEDGPLECPDDRLKALCQLHHNQMDAKMRARHRKEKRGQLVWQPVTEADPAQMGLFIDHVHPLTRGGDNTYDNLVPACRSCNSSKGAKKVEEWRH